VLGNIEKKKANDKSSAKNTAALLNIVALN